MFPATLPEQWISLRWSEENLLKVAVSINIASLRDAEATPQARDDLECNHANNQLLTRFVRPSRIPELQ